MKQPFLKKSAWFILPALLILWGCHTAPLSQRDEFSHIRKHSVLRVTVTAQGYNFHRPWQQQRPVTREAIGVIVPGGRVLVTGLLVADHRYIELETLDTQRKHRAEVEVVDYEANLVLLKPEDPEFLSGRKPLNLAPVVTTGDNVTIWQVKPNGDIVPAVCTVTSVEVTPFSMGHFFLAYRLDGALPYGFANQTLPALKKGSLAGLVLRSSDQQTIDVISIPVIRHFLRDAEENAYQGFPMAGFHYGRTTDPQLRDYLGLPPDIGGIYVQKILKGGPADQSGLQSGDVVTRIGDFLVSNTGQYNHPQHGNIPIVHLIRTHYFAGDTLPVTVFRNNEVLALKIVLDHREPGEYLVPPFILDRAPDYRIVGGFVFTELSLSYLREYGSNWHQRAPIHLLFYNQNQDYLNGDGRDKIVIITGIIPTPFTIGFENLANLVVTRINATQIKNLTDVDEAFKTPLDGFHKIEFEQHPRAIYLDPGELPAIHQLIEKSYRIPTKPIR